LKTNAIISYLDPLIVIITFFYVVQL